MMYYNCRCIWKSWNCTLCRRQKAN